MVSSSFNGNTVSVISAKNNTVVGSPIPEAGGAPESIAFDSANGNLYVANRGDSIVSVISGQTNTVIDSIRNVGHNPDAIAFDSANGD